MIANKSSNYDVFSQYRAAPHKNDIAHMKFVQMKTNGLNSKTIAIKRSHLVSFFEWKLQLQRGLYFKTVERRKKNFVAVEMKKKRNPNQFAALIL